MLCSPAAVVASGHQARAFLPAPQAFSVENSPWHTGKQIRGCLPSGAARPRPMYSAPSLTDPGLLASYARCDSVRSTCSLRASPGFCKTLKQELETWIRG